MKLVAWIIRIVLFALLFVLALRNTDDATLQLFFGAVWHAPLILILLAAFGLGIVAGLAAVAPGLMRQRMEAARLRRALAEARAQMPSPAAERPNPAGPPPREARPGVPYNVAGPKV
ncbi:MULTISPECIES: LapA family protein [unclassified Cupriavidus]|uniref:LapA family protein n=1 Tax=Cupriavidus sp. H19C3 TaxID=3241603 RepID=UPI003BF7EB5C